MLGGEDAQLVVFILTSMTALFGKGLLPMVSCVRKLAGIAVKFGLVPAFYAPE